MRERVHFHGYREEVAKLFSAFDVWGAELSLRGNTTGTLRNDEQWIDRHVEVYQTLLK